jgi:hypothetical protein
MVICAKRERSWLPKWYVRHVMAAVNLAMSDNPGPHRMVLCLRLPCEGSVPLAEMPTYCHESPYLVDPKIEPTLRKLFRRIMVLEPPIDDDMPWPV